MRLSRIVLLTLAAVMISSVAWASPYATTLVDYGGRFGPTPYDDPASVLGAPSTDFYDMYAGWSGGDEYRKVKLVEPAYNVDPEGNKLITTLNDTSYIVVSFDHRVENDAANPYGIDFLVFGNSFYEGNGFVNDETNMSTYTLTGNLFSEDVLVSVSQDGETWYTFSSGPYGDSAYPTNAYLWDPENAVWTDTLSDFTKPVDPTLTVSNGDTAADIIAAYDGSGGGTGYDLDDLYDLYGVELEWIRYIKVEGSGDFIGGEIDAFADVAAVPVPAAVWLLGSGLVALAGMRRRKVS
jgi:hypothetical protein